MCENGYLKQSIKTRTPNPSPIGTRFGFRCFGGGWWIRSAASGASRAIGWGGSNPPIKKTLHPVRMKRFLVGVAIANSMPCNALSLVSLWIETQRFQDTLIHYKYSNGSATRFSRRYSFWSSRQMMAPIPRFRSGTPLRMSNSEATITTDFSTIKSGTLQLAECLVFSAPQTGQALFG